jgi:hypothetical protein
MRKFGVPIGHLVQDDGTLHIGDLRYRYLRDLSQPGTAAYEQF